MKSGTAKYYIVNCFLLTLPVLVWNIALADRLPAAFQPDIFWRDIPPVVAIGENISRMAVFLLALLMPLSPASRTQKAGCAVYTAGLLLYFASWLALLYAPQSTWSNSLWGFLAPAFTPLFWLAGIGLIGRTLYFDIPYRRWMFMAVALVFLAFHNIHALIVYNRMH